MIRQIYHTEHMQEQWSLGKLIKELEPHQLKSDGGPKFITFDFGSAQPTELASLTMATVVVQPL